MSESATKPTRSGGTENQTTIGDLRTRELERGDLAVRLYGAEWYLVVGRSDTPAGKYVVAPSGTLDEWVACPPDDDVLLVVAYSDIARAPGDFGGVADVLTAVETGRLRVKAIPDSRTTPVLERFVEARDRGEWRGVADYVTEVET